MPKGYKYLTYAQRCQTPALLKKKIPKGTIANDLGIHRSTLTREINRNSGLRAIKSLASAPKPSIVTSGLTNGLVASCSKTCVTEVKNITREVLKMQVVA